LAIIVVVHVVLFAVCLVALEMIETMREIEDLKIWLLLNHRKGIDVTGLWGSLDGLILFLLYSVSCAKHGLIELSLLL